MPTESYPTKGDVFQGRGKRFVIDQMANPIPTYFPTPKSTPTPTPKTIPSPTSTLQFSWESAPTNTPTPTSSADVMSWLWTETPTIAPTPTLLGTPTIGAPKLKVGEDPILSLGKLIFGGGWEYDSTTVWTLPLDYYDVSLGPNGTEGSGIPGPLDVLIGPGADDFASFLVTTVRNVFVEPFSYLLSLKDGTPYNEVYPLR